MKDLKHIRRLNESEENLNSELSKDTSSSISDVSDSVFSITEEQLEKLIEKVKDKITDTLDKEGKSTKGLAITNSVSDTIKTYLKKYCC